jgi:hypothetical protein
MTKLVRQGQLGSRKSHMGCVTCKIRRVKCGEERPDCLRCSSTGRKCDGYTDDKRPPFQGPIDTHNAVVTTTHLFPYADIDHCELETFEYFIYRVLPSFSAVVDPDFWCRTLPQLARIDNVVWNAVKTMSQMTRYPQFGNRWVTTNVEFSMQSVDRNHRQAILWYGASIFDLRCRMNTGTLNTGFLLVTCVLYTIIECLQDNHIQALRLFQQAMALAGRSVLASTQDNDEKVGQDTLAISATALLRHMSVAQGSPLAWRKLCHGPKIPIASLEDAREEGYVLLAACHRFIVEAQEFQLTVPRRKDWVPSRELKLRCDNLLSAFSCWKEELQAAAKRSSLHSSHDEELYAVLMLSFYHYYIWMSTSLSTDETSYDAYFPEFQEMLRLAHRILEVSNPTSHRPVFVFEARVIPALTFLATKCRHIHTRRAALHILQHDAPEMEYYFKAGAMARIAAKVIQLEEASCAPENPQFQTAPQHLIPEESRVCGYRVVLGRSSHHQELVECLRYGQWSQDALTGAWSLRERLIEL